MSSPYEGIAVLTGVVCPDGRRRRFYASRHGEENRLRGRVSVSRRGINYTVTGYVTHEGNHYAFHATGKNKDVFKQ